MTLGALDCPNEDRSRPELSLAQARRNELLSLVHLNRALGGGWQECAGESRSREVSFHIHLAIAFLAGVRI